MIAQVAGLIGVAGAVILVLAGAFIGLSYWRSSPGGTILARSLAAPLNGATSAKVDINSGTGHLTVDRLIGSEQALASGTLQYLDKQDTPAQTVDVRDGQASLTLRAGPGGTGFSWFRLPWAACAGGAYEWQVHLNPLVSSDLSAHSDGGNVKLDLAGMAISRVSADTGGGNVDVVLPDNAANLSVAAKTGAGNVTVELGSATTGSNTVDASSGAGNVVVHIPSGFAARVHATSGLGKVIVDPQYSQTDKNTYQSPNYDSAANRVEITVKSGAGNVTVDTK